MNNFTVALIAHDSKKEDMLRLVKRYQDKLNKIDLVATRGTGLLIQGRVGLPVTSMNGGLYGGYQQIGALVAQREVQAVIFLRDTLTAQAHEPGMSALLRACDVHNVPLATNLATAEAVLSYVAQQRSRAEAELALA